MLDVNPKGESNWRGPSGLKVPFYKRTWFSALTVLFLLGCVTAMIGYTTYVQPLIAKADTFDLEDVKKLETASIIYDRTGGELGRMYILNRTPIPIADVPQHLKDALVAQEDENFYVHKGVSWQGLSRAIFIAGKLHGKVTQGGSGITQQLARNAYQLGEDGIPRKIVEGALALRLEKRYSKQELMELYLNRIYFGSGNSQNFYGISAAARGYFNREAKDLTLEEAATIVGLIKSPNALSPLKHPVASLKSRNQVLDRMVAEKKISAETAAATKLKPIVTAAASADPRLTYVYDEIRQEVMKMIGEEKAAVGGFRIYTSIDPALQKSADEAVQRRLAEVESRPGYEHQTYAQYRAIMEDFRKKVKAGEIAPDSPRPKAEYLQGSALVIDNKDGSVLALVGGRDFRDSQYNRAYLSSRPVGTAFLPFLYAAAFSSPAFYPGSMVEDAYLDNKRIMIGGTEGILGDWGSEMIARPYTMKKITAREALSQSLNAATVRLGDVVGQQIMAEKPALVGPGPDKAPPAPWSYTLAMVKDITARAGIQSPLRDFPAAFLGASEARLEELCLAFSIFPNHGTRAKGLHIIQRITDVTDAVIYQIQESDVEQQPVIDEIAAYQTHSCLTEAMEKGTGAAARAEFGLGKFPVAGKSGTHYGFTDHWHLGYTTAVTCGVWAGFDKAKPIYPNAFSNRVALPIWTDIINATQAEYKAEAFTAPENAQRIEICKKSGMRATEFCFDKVTVSKGKTKNVRVTTDEYVRPGTILDNYCSVHSGEGIVQDLLVFNPPSDVIADPVASGTDPTRYASMEPIRMTEPTTIIKSGETDPYNSVQPILKARPVNEDGSSIKRAEPLEEESAAPAVPKAMPVRLAPPEAVRLE
jgi:penicillin-binding protein 1A